ncbi:hypothetical protein [Leptospira sp. GIMC2001]|uniref:hypothetical protein n=1 Tax=Leptospira sp. GIMC2001 TaxID=1513297 RepID=UPI00234BC35A|nr:hypothetical protein [Leptospira sp. GIMC2001]WCL48099.1 hypothetical protein O4O04_12320 [Leptospira sp. GIMC2001]
MIILLHCSIDGSKVKDSRNFQKEKENIINFKFIECGLTGTDQEIEFQDRLLILALFPESSIYELGFLKSHITNKDAEYCYESLYSAPCGSSNRESINNIYSVNILYCNPKSACLGDKQNLGQGELCISGE